MGLAEILRRFRPDPPGVDAPDPALVLARYVPSFGRLSATDRDHLVDEGVALADHLRWEAARGFTVTREMELAIAGTAALLTLRLDGGVENYRSVTSVIVHRSAIRRTGARQIGGGLVSDAPHVLAGEAHHQGPVLLSWDSVLRQSRWTRSAENVVVHEFAHRLDMLDGILDGTPPMTGAALERWVASFTEAYDALRAGEEDLSPLRAYGATNTAEFFAVAAEAFFTAPGRLRDVRPVLYASLVEFFGQDPARD